MIKINNYELEQNKFFDGTFHVKYDKSIKMPKSEARIDWHYENDGEFLLIQMLVKMLKENNVSVILNIPYLPNARMDRTEDSSDSKMETLFTLKYFIELINDLNADVVVVLDPHSGYIEQNLKNVIVKNSSDMAKAHIAEDAVIMFPDKGAYDRSVHLFEEYDVVYGNKTRDWATGEITGYEIVGDVKTDRDVLIIDDICSRGGTFVHAADELRKNGSTGDIRLFATHVEENIKNGPLLDGVIVKEVITTDSIVRSNELNQKLKVIAL